jgi:hypothetical protein
MTSPLWSEAIPPDLPLDSDATEQLCNQLFLLLSLVAGQEIGVAPVVGVDAAGRVVWADWALPAYALSSQPGGGLPGASSVKHCRPSPQA